MIVLSCYQFAVAALRCAIDLKAIENASQSIRYCCAITARSIHNSYNLQSLRDRFSIAAQSLRDQLEIAAPPLCYAIDLKSIRYFIAITA
jgi:hypothetical protein